MDLFDGILLFEYKPWMQNPPNISILPAFGDNYIYLVEYAPAMCFAVDPGNALVVQHELDQRNLSLSHIFITHHHADHIGGVRSLKDITDCTLIGPDDHRVGVLDTLMRDGDTLKLPGQTIRCISTPGHTATSVCYYLTGNELETPVLFSGDTLFVCGCGRMFECDGQTMYASLLKLTALPEETQVYPGHDYTEENIRFGLMIEPDNEGLQKKLNAVREQITRNKPTVPSPLAEEKQLNPFLKAPDWQRFTDLRQKKDGF